MVFDFGGKPHLVDQLEEGVRVKFFHVHHGFGVPDAFGQENRRRHGRNFRRERDGLGFNVLVAGGVIGHVVDENFLVPSVSLALDQVPDAGEPRVVLGERNGIGQDGFQHF